MQLAMAKQESSCGVYELDEREGFEPKDGAPVYEVIDGQNTGYTKPGEALLCIANNTEP